ncbi:cation/H(+) antiporter 28 [Malania oleifera]|uniref:cation/H(+) antiporter 28 n=1 Tax=Malania oleifera TaxID=397392 RepID=UPI0025AE975C|nr:cation/H(+) antiporter 28 [Malania oleifera]
MGIREIQNNENVQVSVISIAAYFLFILGVVVACNVVHALLKRLSQPRMISEIIVSLVVVGTGLYEKLLDTSFYRERGDQLKLFVNVLSQCGMIGYMFTLGLEMDPLTLLRRPPREAKMAYAAMLSSFILAFSLTPGLRLWNNTAALSFLTSVQLSSTAFPLLTRMITDLKIGKSDIGRFTVAAAMHSDLLSNLLMILGYICSCKKEDLVGVVCGVLIQVMFTYKVGCILINWVNQKNPPGGPMRENHLVLAVAFVGIICVWLTAMKLVLPYSVFMTGLFLPREGRVSKIMVRKLELILSRVLYPIVFVNVGLGVKFFFADSTGGMVQFWEVLEMIGMASGKKPWGSWHRHFWGEAFGMVGIVVVGKVLGALLAGKMLLGMHWKESGSIGLFLAVKGHPHVYAALVATENLGIDAICAMAMVLVIVCSVVYIPFLITYLVRRARKRSSVQRMTLQWLEPSNELRMLLCLRGLENLPSSINFTEISRGTSADPGTTVYVTDMIELTDSVAATLVHGRAAPEDAAAAMSDLSVTEMRKQITHEFQDYVEETGGGIVIRRMLAVSTMATMHQDICVLAKDLMVSLIILPFHRIQSSDRKLDDNRPGFRNVNRRVLRNPPCSVGILVDRGFSSINKISKLTCLQVALIFIGGKDDREALAYVGRIARHPGVKLTVFRFMMDTSETTLSLRTRIFKCRVDTGSAAELEKEVRLDDEYFAEFYERHVVGEHVSYTEKYLVSSMDTYFTLQSLEKQYTLLVVGQGGERVNSMLTWGLNDWNQCPELGLIGNMLSESSFTATASLLIIQQHHLRGELDGLEDDFSIL